MNRQHLAATADPGAFAAYAGGWYPAAHLEHILDYLRRVAAGELSRLLVFSPPRHGKSELLKRYVAWYLGRHPDKTVIVASYNDALAEDFGRAVRRLLNSHGKELFGVPVVHLDFVDVRPGTGDMMHNGIGQATIIRSDGGNENLHCCVNLFEMACSEFFVRVEMVTRGPSVLRLNIDLKPFSRESKTSADLFAPFILKMLHRGV